MRRHVKSVVDDVAVTPLFFCRRAIRLASIRTLGGPFVARCMIGFGAVKRCNLLFGISNPLRRLPDAAAQSLERGLYDKSAVNTGVPVVVVFNCGTIGLSARRIGQSWRGTRAPCGRIYGSGRAVASSLFRLVVAGILQCGKLRGLGAGPQSRHYAAASASCVLWFSRGV